MTATTTPRDLTTMQDATVHGIHGSTSGTAAPRETVIRAEGPGIDAEGAALSTAEVWTQTTQQTGILLAWLVLGILFVRSHFRWEPRG